MQLDPMETALIEGLRRLPPLPPQAAEELSALVSRLAAVSPNTRIDWSDAWSDEDLREFTDHSIRQLEADEE